MNKLYTSFVEAEDPEFEAWTDFVRLQSYHCTPKNSLVMPVAGKMVIGVVLAGITEAQ